MRRPSPALVISIIALVFAMGGTGWAVTQLPRNSVGTPQLKQSAVTSAKIKDGTIATADLAAATRTALRGQTGATGATGAQGPPGPSVGAAAMSATVTTINASSTEVVALGNSASASRSGPITVTQASRLLFSATVHLTKPTTGTRAYATCRVQYARAAAAGTATVIRDTDTANSAAAFLPADIPSADPTDATVAISGYQDVAAGSYNLLVTCERYVAPYGGVSSAYAGLTVVAIPT